MTKADAAAHVQKLSEKAKDADKADDALKFSQAACNVANALCALNAQENK